MNLDEIKSAIARLSPQQLAELMTWFQAHQAGIWERQARANNDSSRTDDLFAEIDREFEQLGRSL